MSGVKKNNGKLELRLRTTKEKKILEIARLLECKIYDQVLREKNLILDSMTNLYDIRNHLGKTIFFFRKVEPNTKYVEGKREKFFPSVFFYLPK